MSSNIPLARQILHSLLTDPDLPKHIRKGIVLALEKMTRASPCRRVAGKRMYLSPSLKRRVRRLERSGLTEHQIANATGIRNTGRISEILNRKR
jgi:hypothetical protein